MRNYWRRLLFMNLDEFGIHLSFGPAPVMLWDLDSTLANTLHRRHLIPNIKAGQATWEDYSMLCEGDEPIEGSVALARELEDFSVQIAVSARNVCAQEKTRLWLLAHSVPLDGAILRPPEWNEAHSADWKVHVTKRMLELGADIRLWFEDNSEIAAYLRAETGVPVVGINPFEPGDAVYEILPIGRK